MRNDIEIRLWDNYLHNTHCDKCGGSGRVKGKNGRIVRCVHTKAIMQDMDIGYPSREQVRGNKG